MHKYVHICVMCVYVHEFLRVKSLMIVSNCADSRAGQQELLVLPCNRPQPGARNSCIRSVTLTCLGLSLNFPVLFAS